MKRRSVAKFIAGFVPPREHNSALNVLGYHVKNPSFSFFQEQIEKCHRILKDAGWVIAPTKEKRLEDEDYIVVKGGEIKDKKVADRAFAALSAIVRFERLKTATKKDAIAVHAAGLLYSLVIAGLVEGMSEFYATGKGVREANATKADKVKTLRDNNIRSVFTRALHNKDFNEATTVKALAEQFDLSQRRIREVVRPQTGVRKRGRPFKKPDPSP
jgi:hypothetical protein